jgi:hypothetical protein
LPALSAKIETFPPAELLPDPSPNRQVREIRTGEAATDAPCGGGLRGLFWALLLEGGVVILAAGFMRAWQILRH